MDNQKPSLWQRFRHARFKRMIAAETARIRYTPGVLLNNGKIYGVSKIEGYVWHLSENRVATAKDIRDAGAAKWLYRIYC